MARLVSLSPPETLISAHMLLSVAHRCLQKLASPQNKTELNWITLCPMHWNLTVFLNLSRLQMVELKVNVPMQGCKGLYLCLVQTVLGVNLSILNRTCLEEAEEAQIKECITTCEREMACTCTPPSDWSHVREERGDFTF